MLVATEARARLGHEVTEGDGDGQPLRFAVLDESHLVEQQLERLVVERQVVRKDHQQPAVGRRTDFGIAGEKPAQERRSTDVDPMSARIAQDLELGRDVACRGIAGHLLDRHDGAPKDDLDRLLEPLPDDGGAQDVVPLDHPRECVQEAIQARPPVEGEQARFEVDVAAREVAWWNRIPSWSGARG